MRTPSAEYEVYNALTAKNVVYAVEFYTLSATIGTKYVSGSFADISSPPGGVSYKKYLISVSFSAPRLDLFQSSTSPGTVQIVIMDNDAEFSSFLNSNSIFKENIFVRLKIGFQEMDYDDFVSFTNEGTLVSNVTLLPDLLSYSIVARDALFGLLSKNINGSALNDNYVLGADLTNVETTTIEIVGTAAESIYADQSDISNVLDTTSNVFVCVKIDSEIIRYSTVTNGSPNSTLNTLARSRFHTSAVAHTAGPSVDVSRGIGFAVDPCRVLLHILTTKDATNNKYDLGPSSGAENWVFLDTPIDASFVNIEQIEQVGWKYHAWLTADNSSAGLDYFFFYPYSDALSFVDHVVEVLLKPYGYYLFARAGKLEVGSSDYVDFFENFDSVFDFDSSNIVAVNGYQYNDINEVLYQFIKKRRSIYPGGGSEESVVHNADAITYYPKNTRTTAFPADENFSSAFLTTADQKTFPRYLFGFYNELFTIVKLRATYDSLLVEPGDNVTITLSSLPNIKTGSRGWSSVKGLVIGQDFDSESSEVSFEIAVFDNPHYISNLRSGHYSINKVVEANITDKALSVSTGVTATIEAADAYYDNTGTNYQADRVRFIFRLTQPGYGAGSDHEILKLHLAWLDSGAIKNEAYREYIRFNPQSATAFTFACDLFGIGTASDNIPTEVKVDWVSTTATGSEIPTLELIEVWFIKSKLT